MILLKVFNKIIKITLIIFLYFNNLCLLLYANEEIFNTDPPIPEDGNGIISKWYYCPFFQRTPKQKEQLEILLKSKKINPIDINYKYRWIQDIALFSINGNFLVQANMPPTVHTLFDGLTMGVYFHECGEPDNSYILNKISAKHMQNLGVKSRQLKWTFVEGGELWVGKFSDDSYYAIIDWDVIERAQNWYKYKTNKNISFEDAKKLVASDLHIPHENIFPIFTADKHLDTFMLPLWDQTILLAELDPQKIIEFLSDLISQPNISDNEKIIIQNIINTYDKDAWTAKHIGYDFPYSEINKKTIYEHIYETLSSKFKIKKVFGFFNNLYEIDGTKKHFINRNFINFFNAFQGINSDGNRVMFTNHAHGLSVLQEYWLSILEEHGYFKENIFFIYEFKYNAGIDCVGSICP